MQSKASMPDIIPESSAQAGETSQHFVAIRNMEEVGTTGSQNTPSVTHTQTHSPPQSLHHVTQMHLGFKLLH